MRKVPDILKSKKFQMAILGLVVTFIIKLVPELSELEEELTKIISLLGAAIIATGMADWGKEASK